MNLSYYSLEECSDGWSMDIGLFLFYMENNEISKDSKWRTFKHNEVPGDFRNLNK